MCSRSENRLYFPACTELSCAQMALFYMTLFNNIKRDLMCHLLVEVLKARTLFTPSPCSCLGSHVCQVGASVSLSGQRAREPQQEYLPPAPAGHTKGTILTWPIVMELAYFHHGSSLCGILLFPRLWKNSYRYYSKFRYVLKFKIVLIISISMAF